MAYHWLKRMDRLEIYTDYLRGLLSRGDLYQEVPERVVTSVINEEINDGTVLGIFRKVDGLLGGRNSIFLSEALHAKHTL